MFTVYGIANCDIIKKTLQWLDTNKVAYQFHDYKKEGISKNVLQNWCIQKDWAILLNKRSTTWRELGADKQATITNAKKAIEMMLENNSIIKRPVITDAETIVVVGFDAKLYEEIF